MVLRFCLCLTCLRGGVEFEKVPSLPLTYCSTCGRVHSWRINFFLKGASCQVPRLGLLAESCHVAWQFKIGMAVHMRNILSTRPPSPSPNKGPGGLGSEAPTLETSSYCRSACLLPPEGVPGRKRHQGFCPPLVSRCSNHTGRNSNWGAPFMDIIWAERKSCPPTTFDVVVHYKILIKPAFGFPSQRWTTSKTYKWCFKTCLPLLGASGV